MSIQSEAIRRRDAKRWAKSGTTALSIVADLIAVGIPVWLLVSGRGQSDVVVILILFALAVLIFVVGRYTGQAITTLVQPRRWEEIEHRGVVWGWGSRVPGEVRGPYCPNHAKVLQECGTTREDDAVVVRPASPLCCSVDPGEQFGLQVGVGESLTLGELRAEVRQVLEATDE